MIEVRGLTKRYLPRKRVDEVLDLVGLSEVACAAE
jgi:hypothetical protein